jgi:acyl-CoA dehydrogenase
MTFDLAPETRRLADAIQEWSVAELRPLAREADTDHSVPDRARKAMVTAPFHGDTTAWNFELIGGSGNPRDRDRKYVTATTAVEHGMYGDILFLAVIESGIGSKVVDLLGTEEQKERWLSDAAVKKYGPTGFALTEPGTGSDAAAISTTAKRVDDGWLLNGNKIFCSHGASAGYVVVFATVDRELGSRGIRAFVVERGTPGFDVVRENESKLGYRALLTSALALDRVIVPLENCLGREEDWPTSFRNGLATLNTTRHQVASMAVGIAQASIDEATPLLVGVDSGYSSLRRSVIQVELDRFNAQLQQSRLLIRRAAWLLDEGLPFAVEASTVKAVAPRLAERITARMLALLGPDGYSEDFLFEKRYRDVKILDIWEGTGQIHRKIVAQQLFKGGSAPRL